MRRYETSPPWWFSPHTIVIPLDLRLVRLAEILTLRPHTIDSVRAVCQFFLLAPTKLIKLMDATAGSHQMPLKYNSFMNNSKHWLKAIDYENYISQMGRIIDVSNMWMSSKEFWDTSYKSTAIITVHLSPRAPASCLFSNFGFQRTTCKILQICFIISSHSVVSFPWTPSALGLQGAVNCSQCYVEWGRWISFLLKPASQNTRSVIMSPHMQSVTVNPPMIICSRTTDSSGEDIVATLIGCSLF